MFEWSGKPGSKGSTLVTKSHGYLSVVAIGLIALVAGVGRLTAGYRERDAPPDIVRIPILLASVGFGLVVTMITVRAIAIILLDAHPRGATSAANWVNAPRPGE